MKRKSIVFLIMVTLLTIVLIGCNKGSENTIAAQNKLENHNALVLENEKYLAEIESFRLQAAAGIAENDSLIRLHRANLKAASRHTNSYYINEIGELERQNRALESKMNAYPGKDEDKNNWTIFKEEFSRDMENLRASIKDLKVKKVKNTK